jgi:hypothetical protein
MRSTLHRELPMLKLLLGLCLQGLKLQYSLSVRELSPGIFRLL